MDPLDIPVPENLTQSALQEIILMLNDAGVIKFGHFTLKSGVQSPIYIDLREIISHMNLMKTAARLISATVYQNDAVPHEVLCGVPYGALAIAAIVAYENQIPMVMRRKEVKDHGTKKVVEGLIVAGHRCLIVDDVCTSGASIMETAEDLRKVGLVVTDAVVLLDRESGGVEFLEQSGIRLHAAITITQICNTLVLAGKIPIHTAEDVRHFISLSKENSVKAMGAPNHKMVSTSPIRSLQDWKSIPFNGRQKITKNGVAERLFAIMEEKQSCLAVAVDVASSSSVLQLARVLGPHICILKLHSDIIQDFSLDPQFPSLLKNLAKSYNFMIMEDRKFADIGFTVSRQFGAGHQNIADWADLITVHALPGPGIIAGLREGLKKYPGKQLGIVFIAEMSSKGALTDEKYVERTVKIGEEHANDVVGFVCQSDLCENPGFLRMTPGVHMAAAGDPLGQQYSSPEELMGKCADVIIVGRGVTEAADPASAAFEYKLKAFAAYRARIGHCY